MTINGNEYDLQDNNNAGFQQIALQNLIDVGKDIDNVGDAIGNFFSLQNLQGGVQIGNLAGMNMGNCNQIDSVSYNNCMHS